jgi:hypothetical protein
MAKKTTNGGWWILFTALGLGLLYYLQTGRGQGNDSELLPDTIEGKIDALIAQLNSRFGRRWVDVGVAVLKYQLQTTLPASLVALVDAVSEVENISKHTLMRSDQKQQLAVRLTSRTWS